MRILQFMPQYPGKDGTSAYCIGLCPELNRLEENTSVVATLRADGRRGPEDVPVVSYPLEKGWNPFKLPGRLLTDLRENTLGIDGVVLHGNYNPRAVALGRFLKKIGMPYIFMPHDPYVKELRDHHRWRKWIWWRLFEKRLIASAAAIQLLDERHREVLEEQMGRKVSTYVVPNGCDPKMKDEIPDDSRVPGGGEDSNFLYLGRMDRNQKGLDLLIEGFAMFLKKFSGGEARLILTGNDWEDREELEALSDRLGISEKVTFTGRRPEGAMTIVSEADVLVLTSRFEGFGLCVVEGMIGARPVIVSRRAGVASHVEQAGGGWLVDPNPDSICEGFEKAMASRKDWAGLGKKNQSYVMSQLTWAGVAARTQEQYRKWFAQ